MPPDPVAIPPALLQRAFAEARRAFPAECCGWLAGPPGGPPDDLRACHNAQAAGTHPTAAGRDAETAYTMAGDDLLAFDRAFDGPRLPRVLYHSHPNGRAYFSATDRAVARNPFGEGPTYPVQHLVIGVDGDRVTEAALFAWDARAGDFVEVARFPGDAGRPAGAGGA